MQCGRVARRQRGATSARYTLERSRESEGTAASRSAREQAERGEETVRRCSDRRVPNCEQRERGCTFHALIHASGSRYREGQMITR